MNRQTPANGGTGTPDIQPEVYTNLGAKMYLRLRQIIGDRRPSSFMPALVMISKSTLYAWIKAGSFPPPVLIGPRTAAWRTADVEAWLDGKRDWQHQPG